MTEVKSSTGGGKLFLLIIIAVLLFVYLGYALFNPEKF